MFCISPLRSAILHLILLPATTRLQSVRLSGRRGGLCKKKKRKRRYMGDCCECTREKNYSRCYGKFSYGQIFDFA